ncbi:TPA: aminotransferase class I/II-fold pyridoxal phosphate-dependent enzyme [Serratia rubidaea]|uniref:pyridoxal phosphate-dependent aminotransferase n=1 Tax=Serratia rubidaea TaxID=61652 RepID=UPI0023AFB9CD|nr:aminotransferase class I/II-fold pyridoxal phosphate-dependent enzyme [Serratia rubidaea]MDK1703246.1 aminotransferase class I/II-fold pyridoxal phosphate-dependent enzyme [Serratia rubidaea]HDJ1447006.1 aminotransferase class I/II-fold pyridoxal phosphate-dependent enzyme [Serratia rubidaea]HDJ1461405.1 aminotransferase class I/II-fold pyridoxal phosphate-dependent enzyme [Serratia rubidaea]HDJ2770253.1 aminotransferase class I/II-fold pyridoxal phosphate-dependent enzyme [Serratia rubidaea
MQDSHTMNVKRRQLLKLSGALAGGVALAGLSRSALADALPSSSATFSAPTAEHPIRINFNENPLGMSPRAQAAARDAVVKANRYAKEEIIALRSQLASHYQLPDESILLTAGSSEGIRAAIEAYATLDTQLVIPALTYGDGEHFAAIAGMKITKVPMLAGWQFDINGLKQAVANHAGPSLVYLVNPNNPTATITPAEVIEPWIASKPANTLFIVDEAYAEFVNDPRFRSVGPLLKQGADNVILLKTFSKIYAMAGMRVGYAVAQPALIARLANHVAGEKINFCGVDAALASLHDDAFVTYSKKSNDTSRQILLQALDALNLDYLPSEANFVFFKLNTPLAAFQQQMKQAGILVGRAFPPADDWCRISLGTPQEMTFVAHTLKQFRSQKQL